MGLRGVLEYWRNMIAHRTAARVQLALRLELLAYGLGRGTPALQHFLQLPEQAHHRSQHPGRITKDVGVAGHALAGLQIEQHVGSRGHRPAARMDGAGDGHIYGACPQFLES